MFQATELIDLWNELMILIVAAVIIQDVDLFTFGNVNVSD